MKRTILAAVSALALAAAAPALAQTQLDDSVAQGLTDLGVDISSVTTLTTEQAAQIENVLASDDAEDIKRQQIAEIIGAAETQAGVGAGATGQLRDSVSASMVQLGLDTEGVASLSLEQLTEIEAVASSDDAEDIKRARIEEITGASATQAGVGEGATGQLSDSVAAELAQLGIDTEKVEALTVEELAQIENVVNSDVPEEEKRLQIEQLMAE